MPYRSRNWLRTKSSKGLILARYHLRLQDSGRDRSVENWSWGLALIALTVGIHASGIVSMALCPAQYRNSRGKPESRVAASVRDPNWPDRYGRTVAGGTTWN
jgi:hypothetical protein